MKVAPVIEEDNKDDEAEMEVEQDGKNIIQYGVQLTDTYLTDLLSKFQKLPQ